MSIAPSIPAVKSRKPRTIRPTRGTARLLLGITVDGKRTIYAVKPVATDPQSGVAKMVRLTRVDGDGERYFVTLHDHGAECDCPTFEFDHRDRGTACKHIASCRSCGLL